MLEIVISEFMDPDAVEGLRKDFRTLYDPGLVDAPDDLKAALGGAGGLIVRNRTQVRQDLLDAAPNLKVVGRLGVGLDNIDLDACAKRNIQVKPASGANDLAVAEYAVGMIMVLLRGSCFSSRGVSGGEWPRQSCIGKESHGKTVGFIGYGGIARHAAGMARALGMSVAAYDPYVPSDDPALKGVEVLGLQDLLGTSDAVSLHVPLTDATRNLLDANTIRHMKDGAVLVNTARGGIIDEDAVCDALKSGRLGGAALDVFAGEPVDAAAGAKFTDVPNLVLTPHIAGVTVESNVRVSKVTADHVRAILEAAS